MKTQKTLLLSLSLALLVFQDSFPQELIPPMKMLSMEQCDQLVRETRASVDLTLKKEVFLPGMAVAIVSRDKVLLAEGFGFRDQSRIDLVDSNTIFGILSVSKPVTVTALMIAQQEGLLNFDVPVKTYLPGFSVHSRFPGDPMSQITLRHLISMTSGLTHDAPIGNNADPYTPSYGDHIQSISQTWLRFPPGQHAEYSNLGIELAAYCLEQVIHKPFTGYVQDKVFNPLGMARSTYDYQRIKNDPDRAVGNNRNFKVVPLENPMLAPGAVFSSIHDMARFIRFHLTHGTFNGYEILKEPYIRQMQTIPFPLQDQIAGYAQGLQVSWYHLEGEDIRCIEHGGGGFGFRCQMKWLPDLGYGVMVMTNSQDHNNVNENLTEEILRKIVEMLRGKKVLGPFEWLSNHLPDLSSVSGFFPENLEGNYNGTNDDMQFLVRDSTFGYLSGTTFIPLKPVSANEVASANYLYRFNIDSEGKAISVVRPYDGTQWNLSERRNDEKGPEMKDWIPYEGIYIRKRFSRAERFYIVTMKNGWLHFIGDNQDSRMTEFQPGMFYIANGEVIDFTHKQATYRNIKLYKVSE